MKGLNAGLLSAVFLDKSLGRCNNKIDDALLDYNRTWRPEALAASEISRSLDLGGKFWLFRSVRRLLLIIIGAAAVQNAKSSRISYQDALAMEKRADTMILVAVVVFGLALVWRISKGFH